MQPDPRRLADDRVAVADAAAAREELDWVVRLIGAVRSVRTAMNVPPGAQVPILLRDAAPATLARAERWIEPIRRLARGSEVKALAGEMPKGAAQAVVDEATVVLPLAGTIDLDAERVRLTRERDKAAGEAREAGEETGQRRLRGASAGGRGGGKPRAAGGIPRRGGAARSGVAVDRIGSPQTGRRSAGPVPPQQGMSSRFALARNSVSLFA